MAGPVIGVSDANVAAVDAAVAAVVPGMKVKNLRAYATFDNPAPAYWTALMAGRDELFASEKFKSGNAITPATDDSGGKYDPKFVSFIQFLMTLGQEAGCFDHETDAQTAGQGGTVAQLVEAVLHANKVARAVPGWNGQIFVCVTGFNIAVRGPQWMQIFADADGIMIDQPYSGDGKQSGDQLVGPIVDWFTKYFPKTPLVIGEWGCANTAPNQAAWITQFMADLQKPRYANVQKALYWNAAQYAVSGAALQALARGIAASQAPPMVTVNKADFDALVKAATDQLAAASGYGKANDTLAAALAKLTR